MTTVFEGLVINPESYWTPAYRISPFNTSFIGKNLQIVNDGAIDEVAVSEYFGDNFAYCANGKSAIGLALRLLNLSPEDEVWIQTTTNNLYISGCVTTEIEKFCKWSRVFTNKTKVIFVNHEFGFCFPDLSSLSGYNLPIIEDRALSFASTDAYGATGSTGDFVIYSLPKFFPVNFGGILKCNNASYDLLNEKTVSLEELHFLKTILTFYLPTVAKISESRINNHHSLSEMLGELGFPPRLLPKNGEVPSVYMFETGAIKLNDFKTYMQNNGVESSVFYGENAYFIPVHQELKRPDMTFFAKLIKYYNCNGIV